MKPLNSSVFKNIIQCTWHCHAFLLDDLPLHLEPTSTLSYEGCFLLCCLILSHPHIHLIIQAPWTHSFNLRKGPMRPRLPWHSLCVQGLVGFLIYLLRLQTCTLMPSSCALVLKQGLHNAMYTFYPLNYGPAPFTYYCIWDHCCQNLHLCKK